MKTEQKYLLHPLHPDELVTLNAMSGEINVMPTHCINLENQLEGFCQKLNSDDIASLLSVNRTMFYGHSLFECKSNDELVNSDIIRLMGQNNTPKMQELMKQIDLSSTGLEASFDCVPDNADAIAGMHGQNIKISYARGKRSVDSKQWMPECPVSMGLYHAMVRGYQKDYRQHKLFIAVSGGCPKCSDSFYNLMIDVGPEWSCIDVANSEEVWWLRKASQRARCKIASLLAKEFDLKINEQLDVHSYAQELIGVPTTDTIEFDISAKKQSVFLHNACIDTSAQHNGILCQMNASEGYWLFKGNPRSSARSTSFGTVYSNACEVFPTRSPLYFPTFGNNNNVQGFDTKAVVRYRTARRCKGVKSVFQCFDEVFMRNLENMGWNRDHGVVEMVPITVGFS